MCIAQAPPLRGQSTLQGSEVRAHLQAEVEESQLVLHQFDLHHEPKTRARQLNPSDGSSVQRGTRGGVQWRDWERVPEDPSVTL